MSQSHDTECEGLKKVSGTVFVESDSWNLGCERKTVPDTFFDPEFDFFTRSECGTPDGLIPHGHLWSFSPQAMIGPSFTAGHSTTRCLSRTHLLMLRCS